MVPRESLQGEAPAAGADAPERRRADRRRQVMRALLYGSFNPRRRTPRRHHDGAVGGVDWHHPQWLAIAILILMFSLADALLTLMLIEQGAVEANPVMAPLVGSGIAFGVVKIGLTAAGVLLLTQLARLRTVGNLPVGVLLYIVLAVYGALIAYEFRLLQSL